MVYADLTFPPLLLMTLQQRKPDKGAAYFFFIGYSLKKVAERQIHSTGP